MYILSLKKKPKTGYFRISLKKKKTKTGYFKITGLCFFSLKKVLLCKINYIELSTRKI